MMQAYMQLAEQCDYPLHLGVTEAGPTFQGTIKSAVAFGGLLSRGIGDTFGCRCPRHRSRRSCRPADPRVVELARTRTRDRLVPVVRAGPVDVYTLAEQVTAGLEGMEVPLRVAVMGCVVNGPGEAETPTSALPPATVARSVKGEVIKTVPESQIVETLIEEAMRLAEQMEGESGPVVVETVQFPGDHLRRSRSSVTSDNSPPPTSGHWSRCCDPTRCRTASRRPGSGRRARPVATRW